MNECFCTCSHSNHLLSLKSISKSRQVALFLSHLLTKISLSYTANLRSQKPNCMGLSLAAAAAEPLLVPLSSQALFALGLCWPQAQILLGSRAVYVEKRGHKRSSEGEGFDLADTESVYFRDPSRLSSVTHQGYPLWPIKVILCDPSRLSSVTHQGYPLFLALPVT